MRLVATIVVTVAAGLLMAVVLSFATYPPINGCCHRVGRAGENRVIDYGGVNPWTGEVRLETETYTDSSGHRTTTVRQLPEDYNVPFIPLPVGFAVGGLLTLAIVGPVGRPRRLPSASPSAKPGPRLDPTDVR